MVAQQTHEADSTVSADVTSQLASIDRRLASLEAAQSSFSKEYDDAHSKYLKELEGYAAERIENRRFRLIVLALRVVVAVVLIYVAYRVS